ncbi:gag-pol polyprotein [Cucumis melo var. makuwa]|uniref:Gag-pol polyprotein n=1 Tax=Cucumis melo var. makuwa TaxID=1194695 RepID=A0A5A7VD49_CUCMM|nr:gag-pol polyprotein [Cucumis melo var. makuwa]
MDGIGEGNSTSRPSLLDGGNYGYWKSRMEAFLMSLDMRTWGAIISGWEYPTEKDEAGQTVRKSELKWRKDEDDAAVGNFRALNALFNAVDQNIFKLINTCKSAKAVWDILEVAFEGTCKVKISRLQILTSRFEALQMAEDETKLLPSSISLPSKFNMKVTAIEKANDLSKMKLDKLFGSLRTFKIHLGHTVSRRKPGLALTSVKEKPTEEHKVTQNNDALAEYVVLLTKQVAKLKNQFHKHMGSQCNNREGQTIRQPKISYVSSSGLYRKKDHDRGKGIGISRLEEYDKGIRCHECEEFGHIQSECATYLKCKKKGLVATFSNEEDYSKSDDEEVGMTLISIYTMNDEEAAKVRVTEDTSLPVKSSNRHMTGNANFLSELSECKVGSVVFGDGGKGYQVSFSKDRCNVMDSQNKAFLSGTRLSDNCYHWDAEVNLCNLSKVEEAGLWHKRLGHISGTTISKVTKADAIIGLPSLTFSSLESFSECPVGKQVKSTHKSISLSLTSYTLELLHIDLIGPMQT